MTFIKKNLCQWGMKNRIPPIFHRLKEIPHPPPPSMVLGPKNIPPPPPQFSFLFFGTNCLLISIVWKQFLLFFGLEGTNQCWGLPFMWTTFLRTSGEDLLSTFCLDAWDASYIGLCDIWVVMDWRCPAPKSGIADPDIKHLDKLMIWTHLDRQAAEYSVF